MKARSAVRVAPGGRVISLISQPPLLIRQVMSENPDRAALCLVGGGAGPLGRDDFSIAFEIDDDAAAAVTATGATLGQGGGSDTPGMVDLTARVGARASLQAELPPFIACTGSSTSLRVRIDVDETSTLDWTEMIILGRTGEPSGQVTISYDVRRAGRPLLRQDVTFNAESLGLPSLTARRSIVATCLLVSPGLANAAAVVVTPEAVAMPLADSAIQVTVLGNDAATVSRELASLRHDVGGYGAVTSSAYGPRAWKPPPN